MPWTSTHFSIWHAEGGSNRDAYNVVQIAYTPSLTFWWKICHQGIEQGWNQAAHLSHLIITGQCLAYESCKYNVQHMLFSTHIRSIPLLLHIPAAQALQNYAWRSCAVLGDMVT